MTYTYNKIIIHFHISYNKGVYPLLRLLDFLKLKFPDSVMNSKVFSSATESNFPTLNYTV
jgi:hypothetical protein